jgi:hypothetical protein
MPTVVENVPSSLSGGAVKVVRALVISGFLVACSIPAMADGVYNVTGTLAITGTNACGGPCVETLDFSFDVTWFEFSPGQFNPVILPAGQVTSSGPLGSFSAPDGSIGNNYIGFFDNYGDEIDIDVLNAPVADSPQFLDLGSSPGGAYLWGCQTATCVTDFADAVFPGFSGSVAYGVYLSGPMEYKEVSVPETGTLSYLLLGLGLLLLVSFARPFTRRCGVPFRRFAAENSR